MASAVTGFAKESIDSFSNFEQIQNSLSGVMKSAEKGKALFEDLRKFSMQTTFGVDTLANASSQLISTGTSVDQLKTKLKQLGDIAGGDTNKFNDLVGIFAKIKNTGKASSMQLQQLALRGVPIYQMLNEMGVQGTATADDIEEAFRRMTAAGGQFAGNMNSINETIQGKEGFISDTWREFLTSFAEASGLADAYKAALDPIFNVLQGIVDWLQKINESPIGKAIFQGALVATLGAIAAAILGTVIPALVATIAKLTIIKALKDAINPMGMLIGAGVALVTGAVVGLASAISSMNDEIEATNPDVFEVMAEKLDDASRSASDLAAEIQQVLGDETSTAFRENLEGMDDQIRRTIEEMTGSLSGSMKGVDWRTLDLAQISQNYRDMYGGEETELEKLVEKYQEQERAALGLYNVIKNENVELERQNHLQQMIKENEESRLATLESIHEEYKKTDQYKTAELQRKVAEYTELVELGQWTVESKLNPATGENILSQRHDKLKGDDLKQAKAILQMYKNQLGKANGAFSYGENTYNDFLDVFMQATGIDAGKLVTGKKGITYDQVSGNLSLGYRGSSGAFIDSDINQNAETYGKAGVKAFIASLEEAKEKTNELKSALDEGWKESAEERLESEKETLKTLITTYQALLEGSQGIEKGKKIEEITSITKGMENAIAEQKKAVAEAEAAALEERYQKELESLYAEKQTVGLTEKELEILDYINQGYTEMQAKNLVAVSTATKRKQLYNDELKAINEEMSLIGLKGMALERELLTRQGLSGVEANILAYKKQQLDVEQRLAEARTKGEKAIVKKQLAIEAYQENGSMSRQQRSDYAAGAIQQGMSSMVSGSDVGNALEGFSQGGIWGAIIEVLVGALVKVAKQFDNFDKVMNPVTEWMQKLAPLLQFIFDILEMVIDLVSAILDFLKPLMTVIMLIGKLLKDTVGKALEKLGEIVENFSRFILGDLYDAASALEDEQQKEVDRLKELNKQYQNLSQAIDEQNQYYLKQKEKVNAESYDRLLGLTPVNDLIVTPNGTFNTHPEDTIFAMKHPESLAYGGGMSMNVKIYNERGGDTDVSVTQGKDENEMIVTISKKVASDYAQGTNGWDGAVAYRERRQNGRRVMA